MAKANVINPLTGNKIPLSIGSVLGLLAGGVLLWGVAATSQNIGNRITNTTGRYGLDFTPEPIAAKPIEKDGRIFVG